MAETSRKWLDYLKSNAGATPFSWDDGYFLSPDERERVAASIQQFQLGENSEGHALIRRGEEYASGSGDPWFVPALRLFIAEEQRHADWLGRFLDREGIPVLKRHWVDDVFRSLRKLAGLELSVTVLSTAECIAVPYYRALDDATTSPLLKEICRRILRDEAAHLEYQASTLASLARHRQGLWISLRYALHAAFLALTSIVVWQQHRRVFRASNYCWLRFCAEAMLELSHMEARLPGAAATAQRSVSALAEP